MRTNNINLVNRATTQYINHHFTSMARFGDKILGVNDSGFFDLSGDNDNSVPINAYFSPVMTDFGINNPKRLRFMYLGYESDGNLEVDVSADEQAARTYAVYSNKKNQQRKRFPIGRDGYGRYFSFTFRNTDGADFSVDSADVLLVVRSNGIS